MADSAPALTVSVPTQVYAVLLLSKDLLKHKLVNPKPNGVYCLPRTYFSSVGPSFLLYLHWQLARLHWQLARPKWRLARPPKFMAVAAHRGGSKVLAGYYQSQVGLLHCPG